jgi:hypothetical protein
LRLETTREVKELLDTAFNKRSDDEGMTNSPSVFAYLVFGPGRVATEGKTEPIKITAWRGPGAKLIVQDKDSKEQV